MSKQEILKRDDRDLFLLIKYKKTNPWNDGEGYLTCTNIIKTSDLTVK